MGHLNLTLSSQGCKIIAEEGMERKQKPEVVDDDKETFLDSARERHIEAPNSGESMYKICANSSQTQPQHGEMVWA